MEKIFLQLDAPRFIRRVSSRHPNGLTNEYSGVQQVDGVHKACMCAVLFPAVVEGNFTRQFKPYSDIGAALLCLRCQIFFKSNKSNTKAERPRTSSDPVPCECELEAA